MSYMKGSYLENKTILINLLPYLHVRSLLRLGMVSRTLRAFVQKDEVWYVTRTRFEPYFRPTKSLHVLFSQCTYFLTRPSVKWNQKTIDTVLMRQMLRTLLLIATIPCQMHNTHSPITDVNFTTAPNTFIIYGGCPKHPSVSGKAIFNLKAPKSELIITIGSRFTIQMNMDALMKVLRKKLKI
jgi:hypothetical protein